MAEALPRAWNKETLTGLLGAVVLVAAMIGVFFYERGQFHEYDVTWQQAPSETAQQAQGATLSTGEAADHTFTLQAPSLATVEVTVTWTDDGGDPDTFQVLVEGPDGRSGNAQGSQGELVVEVPVAETPTATSAVGRNEEAAREMLLSQVATGQGQGTWTVTVTLEAAPGATTPVGGAETQADGANDYEVTLQPLVWDPVLEPIAG